MDLLAGFDFDTVPDEQGTFESRDMPPEHIQLLEDMEQASLNNDLSAVTAAFEHLRSTNARRDLLTKPGDTLRLAVEAQRAEIVQYLLCQGVEVTATCMKIATCAKAQAIIELLLAHGWHIDRALGWSDPPALAYAVEDLELTTWFLASGADPNARCSLDKTPLSAAVRYGPMTVIETMFAHGGSIDRGQLLHYAIWRDSFDRLAVVRYILSKGASVNALKYENHPDSYLQQSPFGLGTSLHDAADVGDMDVLKLLIDAGADANVEDSLGHLPYERAEANGHDVATKFLLECMKRQLSVPRERTIEEVFSAAKLA